MSRTLPANGVFSGSEGRGINIGLGQNRNNPFRISARMGESVATEFATEFPEFQDEPREWVKSATRDWQESDKSWGRRSKAPRRAATKMPEEPNYDETKGVVAHNTIHHSAQYPSKIILPVMPKR